MTLSNQKWASVYHPQVVTLIIDDSGSMAGDKSKQAAEAVQDLVVQLQSDNQGAKGFGTCLTLRASGMHHARWQLQQLLAGSTHVR